MACYNQILCCRKLKALILEGNRMCLFQSNSDFILGTHKVIPVLGREGPHLFLNLHPICLHTRLQ